MARDAIATESEQISVRREQINAEIERNRSGEMARQDIAALNRGEVPERLSGRVEARAAQIMEGYRKRPLGAAVKLPVRLLRSPTGLFAMPRCGLRLARQ